MYFFKTNLLDYSREAGAFVMGSDGIQWGHFLVFIKKNPSDGSLQKWDRIGHCKEWGCADEFMFESDVVVGARGFEPPTSCSQSRRATRLRYAPNKGTNTFFLYYSGIF